jgi:S-adenosylmethionine:tRNA ribosyltransferase-isomerase
LLTSEFDFDLPADRIAQVPAEPRDAARLLDTRDLTDHVFAELPQLLREGDLVVVNRTRVIKARLVGHKPSGGRVEALLLAERKPGLWDALVRPARRLRPGTQLIFGGAKATIEKGPTAGVALLRLDPDAAMATAGRVPLPPYIRHDLADPERYQTIFATEPGSAAAPTAGLHFTPEVAAALAAAGIEVAAVTLHIGLDTFRPISTQHVEDHQIHSESYDLPAATAQAIADCRERRGRVVAIGTTVVRVLESCRSGGGLVTPGAGHTSLYLKPGHRFEAVDLLVTNFHLPVTSLLVLVAAFMGSRWRLVYETALQRGYRFASFGDAMLAQRS